MNCKSLFNKNKICMVVIGLSVLFIWSVNIGQGAQPNPNPVRNPDSERYIDENFLKVIPSTGPTPFFGNGMYGVTVGDTNKDGKQEIFALREDGNLYAYDAFGNVPPNFPLDLVSLAGGYSSAVGSGLGGQCVALADLNNDGNMEIIAPVQMYKTYLGKQENRLFALNADGTVYASWPATGVFVAESVYGSPVISDLNGDGKNEIIILGYTNELFKGPAIVILKDDGTPFSNNFPYPAGWWPGLDKTQYVTPSVGDLNNDGKKEIIFSNYITDAGLGYVHAIRYDDINNLELPGWPVHSTTGKSTTAVGDVDNNDSLNVVVVHDLSSSSQVTVTVLEPNGTKLWSKYITIPNPGGYSTSSPSLWDLDGDGKLEIIFGTKGQVNVYGSDGSIYPGWPRALDDPNESFLPSANITVADLDGDKKVDELACLTWQGGIYVWDKDGTLIFHTNFHLINKPPYNGSEANCNTHAIADLRGDGDMEIILMSSQYSFVINPFALLLSVDLDLPGDSNNNGWLTFHKDNQHTGLVE